MAVMVGVMVVAMVGVRTAVDEHDGVVGKASHIFIFLFYFSYFHYWYIVYI